MWERWLGIVVTVVIMMQIIFIYVFCLVSSNNSEYYKNKVFWSSMEGEPSGRISLSQDKDFISQEFISQYEILNEFIVLFYNCIDINSGKITICITDNEDNICYKYSFEPEYLKTDSFCLNGKPAKGFEKGEKYTIAIQAEGLGEEDYIEIGTTINPSKPFIFKPIDNENTLFTKLDYTYYDRKAVMSEIGQFIKNFIISDLLLLTLFSFTTIKYRKLMITLLIVISVTSIGSLCVYRIFENKKWYNQYPFIAHAMGGIDGYEYTNSLEAFLNAYECGLRVFEVDFALTSDGAIVLKHDWINEYGLPDFENGYIPSLEEFKKSKIWDSYTTMDIVDLFELMLTYTDIYIVTDSKDSNYYDVVYQFEYILNTLETYSEDDKNYILSKFIIQIYNDDMLDAVESVYTFEHYIYTLYQRGIEDIESLIEFCVDREIPVVTIPFTMWTKEMNEKFHEQEIKVYIHTINDEVTIAYYQKEGVNGFYTDYYFVQ